MELQFHKNPCLKIQSEQKVNKLLLFLCNDLFMYWVLSLFTDCKVFPLLVNTSWFSYLGEQCPSEIFIVIVICILACMSVSQLIWWFCAYFKLSSACTVVFVFNNCKIRSFSLRLTINAWSDGMLPTKSDLIASYFFTTVYTLL